MTFSEPSGRPVRRRRPAREPHQVERGAKRRRANRHRAELRRGPARGAGFDPPPGGSREAGVSGPSVADLDHGRERNGRSVERAESIDRPGPVLRLQLRRHVVVQPACLRGERDRRAALDLPRHEAEDGLRRGEPAPSRTRHFTGRTSAAATPRRASRASSRRRCPVRMRTTSSTASFGTRRTSGCTATATSPHTRSSRTSRPMQ